jgi:NAD(P)-dependent dehydrogenase (short-subunit alcohol dehydrogenase family)
VKTFKDKVAVERYGAVHLLCNNAGVSYNSRSSWETPLAGWEWVLGVNLMGVVHGIHAFLPRMLEQEGEAHIVNSASTSGLIMNSYAVPYGVSKHAVVALSESLHLELQSREADAKVSVLCPGPVDTEIVDASHRNLPAAIPEPDLSHEERLLEKAFRQYLAQDLSPIEVARLVPSAIREDRFYIFTHDCRAPIETRMTNLQLIQFLQSYKPCLPKCGMFFRWLSSWNFRLKLTVETYRFTINRTAIYLPMEGIR